MRWNTPNLDPDWHKKVARPYGVRPDRVFEVEGDDNIYCLEVDRGTEDEWKQVWPKLEDYKKFQKSVSHHNRLVVLFLCRGYRYDKEDQDRADKLIPLFRKANCGTLFSATTLDRFLTDPKGSIFQTHAKRDLPFHSL